MHVLLYQGANTFTLFRREEKLEQLRLIEPSISAIDIITVYIVSESAPLSTQEKSVLSDLLATDVVLKPSFNEGSLLFWVLARKGTTSPWSSKASDIAHNCGLNNILFIKRAFQYRLTIGDDLSDHAKQRIIDACHDSLTQSIVTNEFEFLSYFDPIKALPCADINILAHGIDALEVFNDRLGLSLSQGELDYLYQSFVALNRNPTETEIMMFGQVNSEHCRHKIFNARWTIDDNYQQHTLFDMIRNTYKKNPHQAIVAYDDNAAVLKQSGLTQAYYPHPSTHEYAYNDQPSGIVLKVETHNHPTAIAPFSGAATGSGGEIRDEAATGRGAQPKAGLTGFITGHLNIPNYTQPWEIDISRPPHIATALEIMLEGPIGSASFNNEFGRPAISGFFRTLELKEDSDVGSIVRSFYKPIMLAGGIGSIALNQTSKQDLPTGTQLIVLGGPAMVIGLGGGAASSRNNASDQVSLDFASVQRANPEMERRAQEVINACWQSGSDNPILSIHDVGAGGLSNALPELVHMSMKGAACSLELIPQVEQGMTAMELWCNESQERYMLGVAAEHLDLFVDFCKRERCPYAVIGQVTQEKQLSLVDGQSKKQAIDLPMSVLFEDMPPKEFKFSRRQSQSHMFPLDDIVLSEAIKRVLAFPCVADKQFLITIGDRTVGGLVARDPMVGPWQVPVADVAVTARDFHSNYGEAMAIGERAPIALTHPAAAARMAVGEAITNLAAASVSSLSEVALSANWMAAFDFSSEAIGLYDAVQAIGMELCPALGISIPVGKDSLSMRVDWKDDVDNVVASPLSLVVTAAAPVNDITKTLTPVLARRDDTQLFLIDLGDGACGLGGSVLTQVYQHIGQRPADLSNPAKLKSFFAAIQELNAKELLLAYHDRSDGGLFVTLLEMSFAAHIGLDVNLSSLSSNKIAQLFTEELGAVVQVSHDNIIRFKAILKNHDLLECVHPIATINHTDDLNLYFDDGEKPVYSSSRVKLAEIWSAMSYQMQGLRDHPECAKQEYHAKLDEQDPGLNANITFDFNDDMTAPFINLTRPKVAILREQGVNGHIEMAAAFENVGFQAIDVHMTDLIAQRIMLDDFSGLVACGGFSYGDVLGAGRGWGNVILQNPMLSDQFKRFFDDENHFSLGVCNGCQMMSVIKSLIPGANHWPILHVNRSEQFEARLSLVQIESSPSVFFKGMEGSVLPVPVAHAQGRIETASELSQDCIAMRFVDHQHDVTERYPFNPNGSVGGVTSVTSLDGRSTIMMPHPERGFRSVQLSWCPESWSESSPWVKMFLNARQWVA